MSTLDLLKQQTVGIEDAYDVDMSETSKGGGGGRLLPAGYAMARLVEYIELGKQIETFQGKPKAPALQFRLGFSHQRRPFHKIYYGSGHYFASGQHPFVAKGGGALHHRLPGMTGSAKNIAGDAQLGGWQYPAHIAHIG